MCAKYSLPPFDWLKLSHHLVSGESTLHEVTLFEARSRIFLPTAASCAALFCCRFAIRASSLGWLVGNYRFHVVPIQAYRKIIILRPSFLILRLTSCFGYYLKNFLPRFPSKMKEDANKLLVKKTTEKVSIINSRRGNFKFIHGPRLLSVFHFGLPMEPYTVLI